MKIGICTQALAINYGGILQNYALQTILKRYGHIVYTLDIGKFTWFDWGNTFWRICIHKLLKHNVKFPMTPIQRNKLEEPLRKFVNRYIEVTKPRSKWYSEKIIKFYDFDVLIVGSDQTWRPAYNDNIEDLYLSFARGFKLKRLAYAASFGTDEWEYTQEQTRKCSQLASQFDSISVREQSGVSLCDKHLHIAATQVLDPTLLLTSEDYKQLCAHIPYSDPFIFAYILDKAEYKINEIKQFAQNKGLPYLIKSAERNISSSDSIEKWLAYFRDAAYVITDSFHGTAFSIIFQKDFFVYGNESRGNSRFNSLLGCVGLLDRIVESNISDSSSVNWKEVSLRISKERERSILWLVNNLED